jgi:hypothetical protein
MSHSARIESIESLRVLRAAMARFSDTVRVALDESESEIRRVIEWLRLEQRPFWKRELVRLEELQLRAKLELQRKEYSQNMLDGHSSFVEEKRALKLARLKTENARDKLACTVRWLRQLEREAFNYKGAVQAASLGVDMDVPVALTRLDNMVDAIESYAEVGLMWDRADPPGPAGDAHES